MQDEMLAKRIEDFLNAHWTEKGCGLFLTRPDGILLCSSNKGLADESAVGVLISGMWQAAETLSTLVGRKDKHSFRLSFDTSADGIYILPIEVRNSFYYLGLIFNEMVNPARLKAQGRKLAEMLTEFIGKQLFESHTEACIFDDITDNEIDEIFSAVGIKNVVC